MSIRNWRTMVEEAEGKDYAKTAYTQQSYIFGKSSGSNGRERVFETRELPGQPYPWMEE